MKNCLAFSGLVIKRYMIMKKAKRVKRDENILRAFIRVYCRENHQKVTADEVKQFSTAEELDENGRLLHPEEFVMTDSGLCSVCQDLLTYAIKRNELCPLDPKPRCKKCHVHCYKPEMRERIRKVMAFSGKHYMKRGRFDWIYKYLL